MIRVVQAGSGGSAAARDVVVLFLVGPQVDADVRAAMGPEPVILADSSSDGRESYADLLALAGKASGGKAIGRVTLAGWSRGCSRVRALWGAGARPEVTLLLDGTHAAHPPRGEQLAAWSLITDAGRRGECRVVATCTSMSYTERLPASEGGPFASTLTVLRALTGWSLDAPIGKAITGPVDGRMEGGLVVLRFPSADIDAPAHVRQQRLLPQFLAYYAARTGEGLLLADRPILSVTIADGPEPAPDFGLAVLDAARADLVLGIHETGGHNRGEPIDTWAHAAGVALGSNWCAMPFPVHLFPLAEKATGLLRPIRGSVGAQDTMAQFRAAGLFTEARDLRPEDVYPGTVPIWRRPPIAWQGHIGITDTHPVNGSFWCLEYNSGTMGDRLARMPERLDNPLLLGVGRFS